MVGKWTLLNGDLYHENTLTIKLSNGKYLRKVKWDGLWHILEKSQQKIYLMLHGKELHLHHWADICDGRIMQSNNKWI